MVYYFTNYVNATYMAQNKHFLQVLIKIVRQSILWYKYMSRAGQSPRSFEF